MKYITPLSEDSRHYDIICYDNLPDEHCLVSQAEFDRIMAQADYNFIELNSTLRAHLKVK